MLRESLALVAMAVALIATLGCGAKGSAPARPDISNGGAIVQIRDGVLLHFNKQSVCALTEESSQGKRITAAFDASEKRADQQGGLQIEITNADPAQDGSLSTDEFYPSAVLADSELGFDECRANYQVGAERVSILGYCKVSRTTAATGEVRDQGSAAIEVVCRRGA